MNLHHEVEIIKNILIFLIIIFCLYITIINAIINNLYKEIDNLKENTNTQYITTIVNKYVA